MSPECANIWSQDFTLRILPPGLSHSHRIDAGFVGEICIDEYLREKKKRITVHVNHADELVINF